MPKGGICLVVSVLDDFRKYVTNKRLTFSDLFAFFVIFCFVFILSHLCFITQVTISHIVDIDLRLAAATAAVAVDAALCGIWLECIFCWISRDAPIWLRQAFGNFFNCLSLYFFCDFPEFFQKSVRFSTLRKNLIYIFLFYIRTFNLICSYFIFI